MGLNPSIFEEIKLLRIQFKLSLFLVISVREIKCFHILRVWIFASSGHVPSDLIRTNNSKKSSSQNSSILSQKIAACGGIVILFKESTLIDVQVQNRITIIVYLTGIQWSWNLMCKLALIEKLFLPLHSIFFIFLIK